MSELAERLQTHLSNCDTRYGYECNCHVKKCGNAADAELTRLRDAIVAKLPVTADGVSAYPGMEVWHVNRACDGPEPVKKTVAMWSPEWCYSTREGAIAAESARTGATDEN